MFRKPRSLLRVRSTPNNSTVDCFLLKSEWKCLALDLLVRRGFRVVVRNELVVDTSINFLNVSNPKKASFQVFQLYCKFTPSIALKSMW